MKRQLMNWKSFQKKHEKLILYLIRVNKANIINMINNL